LVIVRIQIVMAFLALSQHIELLGRILPAVRVALPQKRVSGIGASRAAVVVTPCGYELHPVMNLDKRKFMECEAIKCSGCERPKRLGECSESFSLRLQEKCVA